MSPFPLVGRLVGNRKVVWGLGGERKTPGYPIIIKII